MTLDKLRRLLQNPTIGTPTNSAKPGQRVRVKVGNKTYSAEALTPILPAKDSVRVSFTEQGKVLVEALNPAREVSRRTERLFKSKPVGATKEKLEADFLVRGEYEKDVAVEFVNPSWVQDDPARCCIPVSDGGGKASFEQCQSEAIFPFDPSSYPGWTIVISNRLAEYGTKTPSSPKEGDSVVQEFIVELEIIEDLSDAEQNSTEYQVLAEVGADDATIQSIQVTIAEMGISFAVEPSSATFTAVQEAIVSPPSNTFLTLKVRVSFIQGNSNFDQFNGGVSISGVDNLAYPYIFRKAYKKDFSKLTRRYYHYGTKGEVSSLAEYNANETIQYFLTKLKNKSYIHFKLGKEINPDISFSQRRYYQIRQIIILKDGTIESDTIWTLGETPEILEEIWRKGYLESFEHSPTVEADQCVIQKDNLSYWNKFKNKWHEVNPFTEIRDSEGVVLGFWKDLIFNQSATIEVYETKLTATDTTCETGSSKKKKLKVKQIVFPESEPAFVDVQVIDGSAIVK